MGSEYECVQQGTQIFAGPSDNAVIDAWRSWGINAVRIPLNEDCWLGLKAAPMQAAAYRSAILNFTAALTTEGFAVLLDLHWTSHTDALAKGQDNFLSNDSLTFWASVAAEAQLKSNPKVVFEMVRARFENRPFSARHWGHRESRPGHW